MPWSDDLCPPALQPTHQDIGGAACAGGGSRHRRLGGGHQLRLRETGGWQARVATRRPGWYRGAACALALLCFLQPLQAATGRASAPGEGDFSQQRFRQRASPWRCGATSAPRIFSALGLTCVTIGDVGQRSPTSHCWARLMPVPPSCCRRLGLPPPTPAACKISS